MTEDRAALQALHEAAGWARTGVLGRVAGEGGVLQQIAEGAWDENLTDQQAQDLADLVRAMTEHVRHTRAVAGQT